MEWKTISIFVSSTFRDMHAERDLLRERVFPELEERLRDRHCHLQVTDLRWGVFTHDRSDEDERELQVLSVCIRELDRCRPYFLALLGDRYGFVPEAEIVQAAAAEAGLDIDAAGRSITALEIELGALYPHAPSTPRIYLRKSIAGMLNEDASAFSDAHRHDVNSARKLKDLKNRLKNELPDRIRSYEVAWDEKNRKVTGLDAFGQMVLDDLANDLNVATADYKSETPPNTQEGERALLASFVELRSRGFVGRRELLEHLLEATISPLPRFIMLHGSPGSGKSSLFAQLVRHHESNSDVELLAHSAAMGPGSASVDRMIIRFVEQLATRLGELSPLSDDSSLAQQDSAFAELLTRSAGSVRVVILIDSAEAFEPTQRGRYGLWLPRTLPENLCLIVTSLPGDTMDIFATAPGVENIEVPPLTDDEARDIVLGICRRYGRSLDAEILAALLAHRTEGGETAHGNPLWLTVTTEQLNLIRSDDFIRADRLRDSDPEQRLTSLLTQVAADFPSDLVEMFQGMLSYLEEVHGKERVSAFGTTIAFARHGWREQDLRAILPEVEPGEWSDLDIARLRRSFRGQLVRGAETGFLVFAHQQMRLSVINRYTSEAETSQGVHSLIAKYLRSLPANDALRNREVMHHLLETGNVPQILKHLSSSTGSADHAGAVASIAERLVGMEASTEEPGMGGLAMLASVFQEEGVETFDMYSFALQMVTNIDRAVENRLTLAARKRILEAALGPLLNLLERGFDDDRFKYQVAAGQHRLGEVLRELGEDDEAFTRYGKVLTEAERAAKSDPRDPSVLRNLALVHFNVGQVNFSRGMPREAIGEFKKALEIAERTASLDPKDPLHLSGVSAIRSELGKIYLALGDVAEARVHYEAALSSSERACKMDPVNDDWDSDMATSLTAIGDIMEREDDVTGSLNSHKRALTIRQKLVYLNPDDPYNIAAVGLSQGRIARLSDAQGDYESALTAAQEYVRAFSVVSTHEPGNVSWLEELDRANSLLLIIRFNSGQPDHQEEL